MRKLQNSHVAPWTPIRGQHLTWPQFQSWIPSKWDCPKVSWAQLRLPPNGCLKDHEVKNEDNLLRHQTIYAYIIQHTFPWFVPNRFWNAYSGALVSTQEKGLTLENTWTSAAGPSYQSPSKSPFWWPPGLANRSVGWLNSRFGDLYWYGILYATWKVKTGQWYGMVWIYVRTYICIVCTHCWYDVHSFHPFFILLKFWSYLHVNPHLCGNSYIPSLAGYSGLLLLFWSLISWVRRRFASRDFQWRTVARRQIDGKPVNRCTAKRWKVRVW